MACSAKGLKKGVSVKKVVFLFLVCMSLSIPLSNASALTVAQKRELNPGRVLNVPLVDFSTLGDQRPYDLLESGHDKEAISGFKQNLAANKDDLVAFLGLAQADPTAWPSAVALLERQAKSGKNYNVDFKLGVLYLYQWETDRDSYPKQLSSAQKLLTRSWQQSQQQSQEPIIGLLYAQMQDMLSPDSTEASHVINQLVSELAGPQADSFYQYGRHFHWQGLTPPVEQTPVENLKPLRGVLKLAWSFSGVQRGYGVMHGNNVESVIEPLTAEQEKNMAYLLKWRHAVDKAIVEHKLS